MNDTCTTHRSRVPRRSFGRVKWGAPPWDSRPESGAGVVHYQLLHRPRSIPTALGPAPLITLCNQNLSLGGSYDISHKSVTVLHVIKEQPVIVLFNIESQVACKVRFTLKVIHWRSASHCAVDLNSHWQSVHQVNALNLPWNEFNKTVLIMLLFCHRKSLPVWITLKRIIHSIQ